MRLAIDEIAVNLGVERPFDIVRGAAERHPVARPGDVLHVQTMRFEPSGHSGMIAGREAEPVSKLLGREPLVILR